MILKNRADSSDGAQGKNNRSSIKSQLILH